MNRQTRTEENAKNIVTRSTDSIWLIGYPLTEITGSRLPSGLDVMRNFVYYHRHQKLTIKESAEEVYGQVMTFWSKSRLPTREKHHVLQKIKDLYAEHENLMKSRKRSNEKDKANQKSYCDKLDRLFDISHANSNELIRNEEDRQFLRLQQESRTGTIGAVDKKLAEREKRSTMRKESFYNRVSKAAVSSNNQHTKQKPKNRKETDPSAAIASIASDDNSNNSFDEISEGNSDEDYAPLSRSCRQKRKRVRILSPHISNVLDRTNSSIRKSTAIIASVINEAGCSTSATVLSKSTVHRQRQKIRQEIAEGIQERYQVNKSVVHWDSKLLPDTNDDGNSGMVDRLPILLTSLVDGNCKLLGAPKLPAGTGRSAALEVLQHLHSWNCKNEVVGMCFDTTAVNTGRWAGACTLLEEFLGKKLLWLACRHHVLEVLLSDVFGHCFGESTGPEITLFKKFRSNWSNLKNRQVKKRNSPNSPLIQASEELKELISKLLMEKQIRHDYLEFLQLAAIMIGLDKKITIYKPGACHRARWMAKAIYTMKIELLFEGNEDVHHITALELTCIKRFNRFVVLVYIQSWFTSRSAAHAPVNDVFLIQRLLTYEDVKVKHIALEAIKRHSWYLSPELATLLLFSKLVSPEIKGYLVQNIQEERGPHLLKTLPNKLQDLRISRSFFTTAGIDDSFLKEPVHKWAGSHSYIQAAKYVKNLSCVNDVAERAVSMVQTFNESTRSEEQKQFLLQVVEEHQKEFDLIKCKRDTLSQL